MLSLSCRLLRKLPNASLLPWMTLQYRKNSKIMITSKIKSTKLREHALDLFDESVKSVTPQTMVFNSLKLRGDVLTVDGQHYILNNNVHVVAFGKAVIGMIRAVEDILGDHIVDGVASVPYNIQNVFRSMGKWDFLPSITSKVKIIEGSKNNIPDEKALEASRLITELITKCEEGDIVLVLISGGGSALLPSPISPITLEELSNLTQLLSKRGVSIQQLNTIRKQLEVLKGGGLARLAYPAKMISLILSDVIDNDVGFIASGPTVPCDVQPQQCLDIFRDLDLIDSIPGSVMSVIEKKLDAADKNSLVSSDQTEFRCQNVQNVIIGSNVIALNSTAKLAEELGYGTHVMSPSIVGDAEEVGKMYAALIHHVCRGMLVGKCERPHRHEVELDSLQTGLTETQLNELYEAVSDFICDDKPICLLAAGETTVNVTGGGLGGRCQHMALSAALALEKQLGEDILGRFAAVFLSGGTDGQDGPTDAAGAVCDPHLVKQALKVGIDPNEFLKNCDSHNFFANLEAGRDLIRTGLTGTNVMDVQIILIASIASQQKQQQQEV